MYKFSNTSLKRLGTCHSDLHLIMHELIKLVDFSILCGHRTEDEQTEAYVSGNSKLKFPYSKHNSYPSTAIDIAPYPIDWDNSGRFYWLAGMAVGIAHTLYEQGKIKHKLRYGGDWDMDGELKDNSFNDLVHLELYKP